eukprot:4064717-Prymnesium_polylepis.1
MVALAIGPSRSRPSFVIFPASSTALPGRAEYSSTLRLACVWLGGWCTPRSSSVRTRVGSLLLSQTNKTNKQTASRQRAIWNVAVEKLSA